MIEARCGHGGGAMQRVCVHQHMLRCEKRGKGGKPKHQLESVFDGLAGVALSAAGREGRVELTTI